MPRFRKHSQCPDCKLGRTINGFPCFCPASHSRAFKFVDQPPPVARHVIRQMIVGEQYYQTPHAAIFAAAMSGRSYAASMMTHGELRGLFPGIEVQVFNASTDLRSGEIEVTPNLSLSTLVNPPPPEWNHFADDGEELDSIAFYS